MSYDEEHIAAQLHLLPAAPEGWVRAAQELPFCRAELDEIVARAQDDAQEITHSGFLDEDETSISYEFDVEEGQSMLGARARTPQRSDMWLVDGRQQRHRKV